MGALQKSRCSFDAGCEARENFKAIKMLLVRGDARQHVMHDGGQFQSGGGTHEPLCLLLFDM